MFGGYHPVAKTLQCSNEIDFKQVLKYVEPIVKELDGPPIIVDGVLGELAPSTVVVVAVSEIVEPRDQQGVRDVLKREVGLSDLSQEGSHIMKQSLCPSDTLGCSAFGFFGEIIQLF